MYSYVFFVHMPKGSDVFKVELLINDKWLFRGQSFTFIILRGNVTRFPRLDCVEI